MVESKLHRWRLSLQAWIALLGLGLALWFIIAEASLIGEVLWVLFGALLISLAIRPLVDRLAGWRIPRWLTVLGVYIVLGLFLALVGRLLVPIISTEVARLQASGPALLQQAMSRIAATPILGSLIPPLNVLTTNLAQKLDVVLRTAVGTVASFGGVALDIVVMLVVAFFLTTDGEIGERLVQSWVPDRHRPKVQVVWSGLASRLTRWVWAQLGIALYFAVAFSVGLAVLGVPFAFTIGLVGGVLEVIPYLGGIVALVFALISAITVKPLLALWVLIYYLVVTEVEAHVVAPALFGRIMGLHPAVVLIALLVGAKAAGILGALFAVPTAVVLAALLQEARAVWKPVPSGPDDAGQEPDEQGADGEE